MCHFLAKDSFCPSILTKLPLIDVLRFVYAQEAASAVLQCCHVLIFTSAFRHVVWSHLIKMYGVNKVVCRGYMRLFYFFGVIKQSIWVF